MMQRPPGHARTVSTHLTLAPVAKGALALLADLETAGARSDASPVVVRLIRQELDRVLPGAWEAATARDMRCAGLPAKERAAAVYTTLTERLEG